MSTCTRWLLPINEAHWFLTETGKKLHLAPGADGNRVYNWGVCGSHVDVRRSQYVQAAGSLFDHSLCMRCLNHMSIEYVLDAELEYLRRNTKKLVAAVMSLIEKDRRVRVRV